MEVDSKSYLQIQILQILFELDISVIGLEVIT